MGIRTRFTLAFFLLFLVASLGAAVYVGHQEAAQHLEGARRETEVLARGLVSGWKATMSFTGSDNLARDQLRHAFADARERDPSLRSLRLVRHEGFTRINSGASPYASAPLEREVIARREPVWRIVQGDSSRHLELLEPIRAEAQCVRCHLEQNGYEGRLDEVVGVLALEVSLQETDARAAADRLAVFLLLMGLLCAGLVSIYWISARLTSPIVALTHMSQRIAAGDLQVQGMRAGRDEVGVLARQFASMVEQLRQAHARLHGYASELEERVAMLQRSEEALRQGEERLRGLVEHLPYGVCLLDGEGRVLVANPAAREHLALLAPGRDGETIGHLGEHELATVLAPQAGPRAFEVVVRGNPPGPPLPEPPDLATPGRPLPGHQPGHPARGGKPERTFELAAGRIGEEPTASSWVLVLREVTRERELQSRQQQQARLAALGQLAAGIAHDFGNILTPITGYAQLIEVRDEVPEPTRRDLRTIAEQGQRGAQLIRQILDFSRRSGAERQPVNLVSFVKEALRLLERALPETLRIVRQFDDASLVVNASPTQLQQVLTNLAVNARDAIAGSGELRIGLSRLRVGAGETPPLAAMAAGPWVVWTVADTGAGMPPEVLEHIFEPFYTTKQPGAGTGLGLAQVYGIVEEHGGHIEVTSQVGAGTIFRIYLPEVTAQEAPAAPAATPIPRGQGQVVLVVEDEPRVLETARDLLQSLGYGVRTATTGREGLRAYEAHRAQIALVLTDLVMPEMGGEELIRALRERDPGLPIVVMSGYPAGVAGGGPAAGAAPHLPKPLLLEPLARVVHAALHAAR
ncbi:MAG: ATP-binding protein [Candidatus Latescibacterota bacterium]